MKIKKLFLFFLIFLIFETSILAVDPPITDGLENAETITLVFSLFGIAVSSILLFDRKHPETMPYFAVSDAFFILISGFLEWYRRHPSEIYYD